MDHKYFRTDVFPDQNGFRTLNMIEEKQWFTVTRI